MLSRAKTSLESIDSRLELGRSLSLSFSAFIRHVISCYAYAFTCFIAQENPHSEPLFAVPLFLLASPVRRERNFQGVSTLKWGQNGPAPEENETFFDKFWVNLSKNEHLID